VCCRDIPCPWLYFCFFFSSRRRHTRFSRDWSSDVCSSDLVLAVLPTRSCQPLPAQSVAVQLQPLDGDDGRGVVDAAVSNHGKGRSEERRVGKECRSRRGADHTRKKVSP